MAIDDGLHCNCSKQARYTNIPHGGLYDDVSLSPVILVNFVFRDLESFRCIHKPGFLLQAFFRGDRIGVGCVNTYQFLVIIVNVPEQVNVSHGWFPSGTE